jgi:pantothenate kinase
MKTGKTTFASTVANRLNRLHNEEAPGCSSTTIAVFLPMDGYHLYRAELSAMSEPHTAHARRGAAFTFDDKAFYELVKTLRQNLLPETKTVYAPSFDHAVKDPVADDIPIHPTARIVIFEGNYLSLNKGLWRTAAELMDELWFVEVDFDVARNRLMDRHVEAGIAKDREEGAKRADEVDLVNGREIVDGRLDVHEVIVSREDDSWKPGAQEKVQSEPLKSSH